MIRPLPAAGLADVRWFDVGEVSLSRADLADLGPDERQTGRGLAFAADRHRYRAAHVLLRRVLSGYTGLPPGQLEFGRERCPRCGRATGRPVLRGCSGPQFSLSRSGDAVAIAVSAAVAVGIDAERASGGCVCPLTAVMPGPAARQLTPLAEPARHAAILRWWVRAEAVLKCQGAGISHGFGGWSGDDGSGPAQIGPARSAAAQPDCSVRLLAAPAGYHAALALRLPPQGQGSVRAAGGEPAGRR